MLKVIKKTYRKTRLRKKDEDKTLLHANCFLSESEEKRRRKRLSCFVLGLAIVLIAIPSIFLLKHRVQTFFSADTQIEVKKNQDLMTLALLFYTHYRGFDEYCTSKGQPLTIYPERFMAAFPLEFTILTDKAKEYGIHGTEKWINQLKKRFEKPLEKTVVIKFVEIKKFFEQNSENKLNLSDQEVCKLLDEKAMDVLINKENKDYKTLKNLSDEITMIDD